LSDVLIFEDLSQQHLQAQNLAASLEAAGFMTRILPYPIGKESESLMPLACRENPRLVILSVLFAHPIQAAFRLADELRIAGYKGHITMAGALPALAYMKILNAAPSLDSILGERQETAAVELAASLAAGRDWRKTSGLAHRVAFARSAMNPALPPSRSGSDWLQPKRDDDLPGFLGYGYATIAASHGCYHTCTFCLPRAYQEVFKEGYRMRPLPSLMDEIQALYKRGARLFLFDDEQFLAPAGERGKRAQAFAKELKKCDLRIAFTLKCRPDDVEADLFAFLKEMGLVRVYVGIESGSPETLKLLGKGLAVVDNKAAMRILNELNIPFNFRSLLINPWSTIETIMEDIDFLVWSLPYCLSPFDFREVEVYLGTPLSMRLWREGRAGEQSWLLSYALQDERAECLRRFSLAVFAGTHPGENVPGFISRLWFAISLLERFGPSPLPADCRSRLLHSVEALNRTYLAAWQSMLDFCVTDPKSSFEELLPTQLSAWTTRLRAVEQAEQAELNNLWQTLAEISRKFS
jgi:anaerobic magnesium-protoporphyrin IX monomethyl ester cyclase